MVKLLEPILTLRLGDVDFCLIPNTTTSPHNNHQQVSFHQEAHEVVWTLTNFTGTLRVSSSSTSATSTTPAIGLSSNKSEPHKTATTTLRPPDATSTTTRCHSSSSGKRSTENDDLSKRTTTTDSVKPPASKKMRNFFNSSRKDINSKSTINATKDSHTTNTATTSPSLYVKGGSNNSSSEMDSADPSPSLLGQVDLSQSSDRTTAATLTSTSMFLTVDDVDPMLDDQNTLNKENSTKQEVNNRAFTSSTTNILDIMNNAPSNSQATDVWTQDEECESSNIYRRETNPKETSTMMMASESESSKSLAPRGPPLPPASPKIAVITTTTEATTTSTTKLGGSEVPRVSLGSPAGPATAHRPLSPCGTNKTQLPCPRWAHTMTEIDNHRLVLYGGQTIENSGPTAESGNGDGGRSGWSYPKTLRDVLVFDTIHNTWFQPYNCDGVPRQWHTATYIPDRQLLIAFGGETCSRRKSGDGIKVKTLDSVMVLDTEIMLWYPPTLSGDIPSARSGHSATLVDQHSKEIVVFGGVKGSKWLNTVYTLDVDRWRWSLIKVQGVPPKPRSYHSATALPDQRIVIFGGNNAESCFNSVHVLQQLPDDPNDAERHDVGKCWRWTNPTCHGILPSPRTGHSATLLKDQKTICIYGGWDPNAEEEDSSLPSSGDDLHMFSSEDCFLLDTSTWTWRKGGKATLSNLPPNVRGSNGSEKRVGHTAAMVNDQVLMFGGRIPSDRFTGDFQVISEF